MDTASFSIQPIAFEQTYALRHAVLWPDKPLDYVTVADDSTGFHTGAFYKDDLVGVISLFVSNKVGRFRKFAVHPDFQHQGIGTQLLKHVIAQAQQLTVHTLWCDSRLDASAFYQKFEMVPEGPVFFKGAIPYTRMTRNFG